MLVLQYLYLCQCSVVAVSILEFSAEMYIKYLDDSPTAHAPGV